MENGKLKKENIVSDKSFAFAVRIVKLYQYLANNKKEYVLSKQILRSGTSIGANVSEVQQGQSKKDFLMKMNISLKECSETKYWIKLLAATDYIDSKMKESIYNDCVELEKLLTAIVNKTAKNIK
ncbi:MAG: four helix bundle protein [Alphaproteobacteria bacterium]|nr:four helix bundle protein [Alphaproteobacteria bacterium]MCL2505123.1 four helix bundle protein [Alphaproteobacteria bacterium]